MSCQSIFNVDADEAHRVFLGVPAVVIHCLTVHVAHLATFSQLSFLFFSGTWPPRARSWFCLFIRTFCYLSLV